LRDDRHFCAGDIHFHDVGFGVGIMKTTAAPNGKIRIEMEPVDRLMSEQEAVVFAMKLRDFSDQVIDMAQGDEPDTQDLYEGLKQIHNQFMESTGWPARVDSKPAAVREIDRETREVISERVAQ